MPICIFLQFDNNKASKKPEKRFPNFQSRKYFIYERLTGDMPDMSDMPDMAVIIIKCNKPRHGRAVPGPSNQLAWWLRDCGVSSVLRVLTQYWG